MLYLSHMREPFRRTLNTYNELIKEDQALPEAEIEGTDADEARQSIVYRLTEAMQSEAYHRETSTGVQYEIFEIQQRKQALMQTLHIELKKIDTDEAKPERVPLGARHIIQKDNALFWQRADRSRIAVTLGDILTDLAWNTAYHIDPVTVPRTIRKRFLIEQTRQKVERLLDLQILTEESASNRNRPLLKDAYEKSKACYGTEQFPFGIIAEKILVQLVKKWIIDGDIPFRVRPTDIHHDITRKIDFVITRKQEAGHHTRAVQIKKTHNLKAKAIQFTLNDDPELLRHKQEQIDRSKQFMRDSDRIDDLLLVTLRSQPMRDAYNKWRDLGKPPGGPAGLLSIPVQKYIFEELLAGLIDKDESRSYWEEAA